MSATSVYAAAHEVTVNVGGGALPCTDGSLKITFSTFDTTNIAGATALGGALFEEFGNDTVGVELSFKVVVDKNALPSFQYGRLLSSVAFTGPDGVAHSGAGRINGVGKPIATKGAFLLDITAKYTGSVSNI